MPPPPLQPSYKPMANDPVSQRLLPNAYPTPIGFTQASLAPYSTHNSTATAGFIDPSLKWVIYCKEAKAFDENLMDGWQRSMDVFLVVASIFSAILTAFLIEWNKRLQQDSGDAALAIVAQIAQAMRVNDTYSNIAYNAPSYPSPFKPTIAALRINQTWLFALWVSVASCVLTMLAKAWLAEYTVGLTYSGDTETSLREQACLRQYRWEGLNKWLVPQIIALIPLILHLAVLLFAVGLAMLFWELEQGSAQIITFLTSLSFTIYACTTFLPCLLTSCPYKTPLSHFCMNAAYFPLLIKKRSSHNNIISPERTLLGNLARAEKAHVGEGGFQVDDRCEKWLLNATRCESIDALLAGRRFDGQER